MSSFFTCKSFLLGPHERGIFRNKNEANSGSFNDENFNAEFDG